MAVKKAKVFFIVLILFAGLVWGAAFQLPDNRLHLVFCDVGQGDATLITYRATQILIDGGPNNRVLDCLSKNMPFWDRTIEMIILTHPEADHFTGLIDVVKRYSISQFVINSIANDSAGFWKFREEVLAKRAAIYSPQAGDKLKIGRLEFLVLWPKQKLGNPLVWHLPAETDKEKIKHLRGGIAPAAHLGGEISEVLGAAYSGDVNETSIVLQLSFGNFDTLLTGDIISKVEDKLGDLPQLEVLKIAHHGSKYSSSADFLEAAKPKLAVISVGRNPFGHPTQEVIERLSNLAIKFLRTDQDGEIKIVSDGKNWGIKP